MQGNTVVPAIRIAGIILAAGSARRFGSAKQLLEVDGQAMVRRAVQAALLGGLYPIVVVLGARADQVAAAIEDLDVTIVNNRAHADGLSTSIKSGIAGLGVKVDAIAFLTSDQPGLDGALVSEVVAAFSANESMIVRPVSGTTAGHPVIFDSCFVKELMAVEGDVGGAQIIARHPEAVHEVSIIGHERLRDVDRPEDV